MPACLSDFDRPEAADYKATQLCLVGISSWLDMYNASLTTSKDLCDVASSKHNDKVEHCKMAQAAFETSFCDQQRIMANSCSRCAAKIADQESVHAAVNITEHGRKGAVVAARRIQCYLALLGADHQQRTASLDNCSSLHPSTSDLDIVYHPAPQGPECNSSAPHATPCGEEWLAQHYQSKDWYAGAPTAACTPCESPSAPTSAPTPTPTSAPTPAPTPAPPPVEYAYVMDTLNLRVQQCPIDGDGACSTVAGGHGSGLADNQFHIPSDLALALDRKHIFIADTHNHRVQRCPVGGDGACSTVAGGRGAGAANNQLHNVFGVALSPDGNDVFIADQANHRVQRCPVGGDGACSTVAGGRGAGAANNQLDHPWGVVSAPDGSAIFVTDHYNHRVQRCPVGGDGACSTVAGGRGAGAADNQLFHPIGVAITSDGSTLFIVDKNNHRVQRCPVGGDGACSTVAGGHGRGTADNQLNNPYGIAVLPDGSDIFIADYGNNRVRRCPVGGDGACSTVAGGNGEGAADNQLNRPRAVALG